MANYDDKLSNLEFTNPIENRIIDAFMTLYSQKPIEQISIKTITDSAGLNRGTFYLHYLDIYDLLEKIESKYHDISKHIAVYSIDALFNDKNLEAALPSKAFYASNLKYFKVLLCMEGKSNLRNLIKNELKAAILTKYKICYGNDETLNAYILEYMTSAQVAMIIQWIQNDLIIPLRDISTLMRNLASNSVSSYLIRINDPDLSDLI